MLTKSKEGEDTRGRENIRFEGTDLKPHCVRRTVTWFPAHALEIRRTPMGILERDVLSRQKILIT